jgi:hypothetical protein
VDEDDRFELRSPPREATGMDWVSIQTIYPYKFSIQTIYPYKCGMIFQSKTGNDIDEDDMDENQ